MMASTLMASIPIIQLFIHFPHKSFIVTAWLASFTKVSKFLLNSIFYHYVGFMESWFLIFQGISTLV